MDVQTFFGKLVLNLFYEYIDYREEMRRFIDYSSGYDIHNALSKFGIYWQIVNKKEIDAECDFGYVIFEFKCEGQSCYLKFTINSSSYGGIEYYMPEIVVPKQKTINCFE